MALNEIEDKPSSIALLQILGLVAVIIFVVLWTYAAMRSPEEWRRLLDIEKAKVERLRGKLRRYRISEDEDPSASRTTNLAPEFPENEDPANLISRLTQIQSADPTSLVRIVANLMEQIQIYEEILPRFRQQEANLTAAVMEMDRLRVHRILEVQSLEQRFSRFLDDREFEIRSAHQAHRREVAIFERELAARVARICELEGRNRDLELNHQKLVQDFSRVETEEAGHATRILHLLRLMEAQDEPSSTGTAELRKEFHAILNVRRATLQEMRNFLQMGGLAAASSSSI